MTEIPYKIPVAPSVQDIRKVLKSNTWLQAHGGAWDSMADSFLDEWENIVEPETFDVEGCFRIPHLTLRQKKAVRQGLVELMSKIYCQTGGAFCRMAFWGFCLYAGVALDAAKRKPDRQTEKGAGLSA